MPLFISYSHKDFEFVDKLARQLVAQNINVWIDRWELSIGDSLVDKVQEAVDGSSALLVILSKSSTSSEWCKRELSSGLLRELEEKRVVVMPVLLEECDIPIFARGKLYADFRTNFDDGLRTIVEGVAKVTNSHLARKKEPEFTIDYSLDWGDAQGQTHLILTFVEQSESQPYSCLTVINILCSLEATKKYKYYSADDDEENARKYIIEVLYNYFNHQKDIRPVLTNSRKVEMQTSVEGKSQGEIYFLTFESRRLGEDTGKDIVLNSTNLIRFAYKNMCDVLKNKP